MRVAPITVPTEISPSDARSTDQSAVAMLVPQARSECKAVLEDLEGRFVSA